MSAPSEPPIAAASPAHGNTSQSAGPSLPFAAGEAAREREVAIKVTPQQGWTRITSPTPVPAVLYRCHQLRNSNPDPHPQTGQKRKQLLSATSRLNPLCFGLLEAEGGFSPCPHIAKERRGSELLQRDEVSPVLSSRLNALQFKAPLQECCCAAKQSIPSRHLVKALCSAAGLPGSAQMHSGFALCKLQSKALLPTAPVLQAALIASHLLFNPI